MKAIQYLLIFCCLWGFQTAAGQNKSEQSLFDRYADTEGITTVYISKTMLGMVSLSDGIDSYLGSLKGKITALNILTCEEAGLITQLRSETAQMVSKNYEELMRVRDGQEQVVFYAQQTGEQLHDLLMVVDEKEPEGGDFTLIQLKGNFTLKDVQGMTRDK
ncbi:MAG: DUF4252 domain-containing protein [Prevotellaceae bacterium]|jgi:hypothetical protein|nr:DUF4252 domain-containing protein [Prevotellaceae bacterium]MDR0989344.1 DUF4252 domain-containing protein [Prevotellaceae bacterium]